MNPQKAVLTILAVLFLANTVLSEPVVVELPVPVPLEPVSIFVSNQEVTGNEIEIDSSELFIQFKGIEKDSAAYVGVNKDIPENLFAISIFDIEKFININPYDDTQNGIIFKLPTEVQEGIIPYTIEEWDQTTPIKITLCQDKNQDGTCTGNERKEITIKPFTETITPVSITVNGQAVSGNEISVATKNLSIQLKNIEKNKRTYVSINKTLSEDLGVISVQDQIANLTDDIYDYQEIKDGRIFFLPTDFRGDLISVLLSINQWDLIDPIEITVCQDKDGDDKCTGGERATVTIKPSSEPTVGECGNNVIEGNEECDNGAQNGTECNPEDNASCTYCNQTCNYQTVQGGFCGDGIVNVSESCDGEIPAAISCKDLDYKAGDLACNADCTFNTEDCIPYPPEAVYITVNGERVDEEISLEDTEIKIGLNEIVEQKDFFVAINSELSETVSEIKTGKDRDASPPFDYVEDEIEAGALFFAKTTGKIDEIPFSILDWDGEKEISIVVCQDKDDNGECTGDERAKVQIFFGEKEIPDPPLETDLQFSEMQEPDGTTIEEFNSKRTAVDEKITISAEYVFEDPDSFVLKIDGIDTEQNLWLATGTATCDKIKEEQRGVANLQAASEAEAWGTAAGEAAGKAAYEGGVWTGRTVKTGYEYTEEGVVTVWSVLKGIGSGFISGLTTTVEEQKEQVKEAHTTVDVNLAGEVRREIPNLRDIEKNKSYSFEKGDGLADSMFWLIEKIGGKPIKDLDKEEKVEFFACQKTADNILRETKVEIQFGEKEIIITPTGKTLKETLSILGKTFSQKMLD